MPKVSVILVLYNSKQWLPLVFPAVINQTHKDLEIVAVINSDDGSKEYIEQNFPQVKILHSGINLGFAGGNNFGIRQTTGEFIQLVNPDLILEPDYIEKMLAGFVDPKIAAATGKLLRYDFEKNLKTNIIDSTGVTMSSSGRAKDRGQLQEDQKQFDNNREVFGVSGAGPMYRRSALEQVKYCTNVVASGAKQSLDMCEYFDEDFVAYWEDVDLSWRLNRAGFKHAYVPEAVAYHGRTAGQSKGGYLHLFHYVKHHNQLSVTLRQLNYKNHILMYLKNAPYIHPLFILRELAMFVYVLFLETSTLKVLPQLFHLIPKMRLKRKLQR